jgi:Na+/H+-dicarboxylate symporter
VVAFALNPGGDMKIWLKLLVGIILGVLLAFVIPDKAGASDIFNRLAELFIQIGRYAVIPLIFFSLIVGIYQLKVEKKILSTYRNIFLFLSLSTALLVFVSFIAVFVFRPRMPVPTMEVLTTETPDLMETLKKIFPSNLFAIFTYDGNYLLPFVILAFVFGANLSFDRVVTRSVIQLCDSLSRIFYHIISLIVEMIWIAFIVIAAADILNVLGNKSLSLYGELILILAITTGVVVLGIYPLILYLLDRSTNPYKLIYSSLAMGLTGFFSGDQYLCLGMLVKHGKENMRVPRELGSSIYPLFAVFGRAGTAMVASISFFLILNSLLPSADIDFLKILYVFAFSFIFSFTLGAFPGLGTYVLITLLCFQFDKFWPAFGLLNHYKILEPIKLILVAFGVLIDAITAYLVSYLIARKNKTVALSNMKDYI